MSSIQEDLFPDHRLVIQTVLFLVTLFFANLYIVKPALRLSNERRRRTSGAIGQAKNEIERAEALETSYDTTFKMRLDEVKSLRLAEISAGHKEADSLFASAQAKWEKHLVEVKHSLDKSIAEERTRIPTTVNEVVNSLMQRLGALIVLVAFAGLLTESSALAAGSTEGGFNVMEGLVWPYFQFLVYFAAIVLLGNKVIHSILESRRDTLRVKLSEAKQALTEAKKKASEYESKMSSMNKELDELRKQYIQDGAKEREKILAEAHALVEQMAKDAERSTREMITRGKEELRREVVEKALSALEAKITPDVALGLNKKLNNEALDGIQKLGTAH